MRRALTLAALCATIAARQDYSCREDVCFYHVPKTGGDSFKYLLRDELKKRGQTFWSNEWCPRRSNGTAAMLFRDTATARSKRSTFLGGYLPKKSGGASL